jgi:hypothetical protein
MTNDDSLSFAIRERPSPRPTLLVFEVLRRIAKADMEEMAQRVGQAFDAYDKIDILLIMSNFEGVETGAVFDRDALAAQVRSISLSATTAWLGPPFGHGQ